MNYQLQKNDIIYVHPGRRQVEICVVSGEIWMTVPGDIRDRHLKMGDRAVLKNCGKAGIQALTNTSVILRGRKIVMNELIRRGSQFRINRVTISQAGEPPWGRGWQDGTSAPDQLGITAV